MRTSKPTAKKLPVSHYEKRMDQMEKDYLDAPDRLVQGTPSLPSLVGKRYRITPTIVAHEAGHSRNPLYQHYPHILEKIRLAAKRPTKASKMATAEDKIAELREEILQLKQDKRNLATENLSLLRRLEISEREKSNLERQSMEKGHK